jgi:glyoxylase-like metal-dependent hydrolase (beta-lactamase superfamily II)
MKTQLLGQMRIDRVVESEGPFAAVDFLLPQVRPEQLEPHHDWLRPRFLDERDQLVMGFHSFVLRTPRHNILIDTCVGNDKERPQRASWHRQQHRYIESLARLGLAPEQIDYVCCTHLHADHVGWNTCLREGQWQPTFPKARYVFSKREYSHWEAEHRLALAQGRDAPNHGSFADSVLPVVDAGQALMVDDDGNDFEAGVRLESAAGHTPGSCVLHARSGGAHAVFTGDIFHTPVQLIDLSWSSRFCHDATKAAQVRRELAAQLTDTSSLLMAAHFPSPVAGRIVSGAQGLRWQCDPH